tara:strand:- start:8224 stop:8388 length:165 start_codon:yes stop_codon:yes gene_type:complete
MWKPDLKKLTDPIKKAKDKAVGVGKGLGENAKNIGKDSVGKVKSGIKKLNPFKK